MKFIDTQTRLECASAAVAVLRTLKKANTTIAYQDFAKAIGLMSDRERWQAWHQQQVRDILNLVAATERKAGVRVDVDALEYDRVVKAKSGRSGKGLHKISKIVTE